MKDNSTLKSLNRKFELEFREAQLYVLRLEQILCQRKVVEDLISNNIELLNAELELAKNDRKKQFLAGISKASSLREEQIQKELTSLKQKLLNAGKECRVAEDRIEKAKLELELRYKQREGFQKIEDERETQNERIKVEAGDTD